MPVEDNAWFNKKMFRGLKAGGYVKADKKVLLVFIVNYATMHKTTKKTTHCPSKIPGQKLANDQQLFVKQAYAIYPA